VLLPHTEAAAALEVAEKLRNATADLTIETTSEPVKVTVSLGVASLGQTAPDFDALLDQADKALYAAKTGGRNRSVLHGPPAQAEAAKARRRVLKGGRILFNDRGSSMDCTVRSLSEDGAGIDVSSTIGLPKVFDLAIAADGFERACRMTSGPSGMLKWSSASLLDAIGSAAGSLQACLIGMARPS
jgi:hypothetical protein